MNELMVAGTEIRKDERGRYCLNDLHKAAGGAKRHAPNEWLRNKQTKALVEALHKEVTTKFGGYSEQEFLPRDDQGEPGIPGSPVTSKKDGVFDERGTFIVKELVYAYAMWISPAFNLRVIRAYDAMVSDELAKPLAQMERYWFERREFWPLVRPRVLAGERYRDIADDLGIKRPRVGAMVKSMVFAGLLDPLKVAEVQHGPARRAALRYAEQLGLLKQPTQLTLWGGQP